MRAVYNKMDASKLENTFEIYGYDFMVDQNFKMYLIEVNTNPCLDQCCPILQRLIPDLLDNAFKISVDPLFLPPVGFTQKRSMNHDYLKENRFELVFDSDVDGQELDALLNN